MAEQTPQFGAEDVELIDHSSVYKGFFEVRSLTLKHRLYEGGWSQAIKRELFVRHDAVGVLLYDPALDAVALVEQFRVGAYGHQGSGPKSASPWLLELVAGLIDKDESPELVAQREAEEEAGALISDMLPIYQYFSSPGGSCEFFHLYCGRSDLSAVGGIHGLADEAEDIRVQVIPVAQAWQKLQRGDINNAHSIIALQWLMMNKTQVQEQWR
ncbi:NUDIX domain-containing protein [Dasania sp. GY-MA-18]|uniref:ADP-ribose pyrophosphatase n=1 Tax=Dasania phycosphaerae TaxID=2950436 RepID=A0A9J6RP09_9GAMM|nr:MULTISPECIES: NUDIX domain-containing protein [Dasania]MCR8923615.1 NUDIX domain-containing protein [Dasania sp. GY-MA-18]MCZ0866049.1 NUDIX domain-containing protein [Dasania phycosphaerae]MCZ0869773.1 NUDIX domain-containing protein [Dasania phycosphaerae]